MSVLGYANQRGTDAAAALKDLIANVPDDVKEARMRAQAAKVFTADPFIKPDYDTLAQDVRGWFRQRLGRNPTDGEMAEFTGVMAGQYRAAHNADVAADRAAFEADRAAIETGVPQTPGTIQAVDPAASFAELMEARFRPEMDFREAQAASIQAEQSVFSSLNRMQTLIGGG